MAVYSGAYCRIWMVIYRNDTGGSLEGPVLMFSWFKMAADGPTEVKHHVTIQRKRTTGKTAELKAAIKEHISQS
jgi:hypothetical protein